MKKIQTYMAIIMLALLCAVIPISAEEAPAPVPVLDSAALRTLLRTINFEINSAVLTPTSFESLDSIAALFKQNAVLRYEIQGHSDSIGSAEYNELLSGARAGAVKNYIISKGVPAENIIAMGYGMAKPIASNSTSSGRAANRRVEILLIESQEKYEELKASEAEQIENIQKAGIIVSVPEPESDLTAEIVESESAPQAEEEPEPEPEPAIEVADPEPCPQTECEACPDIQPVSQPKSWISVGIGGFFSNDFGGGFKLSEFDIKNIVIPSAETKTPWVGGGIKIFLDATYAEIGAGLTFGSATIEIDDQIEVDWSFTALTISLLCKYPIGLYDKMSLFPAIGIDYQMVLLGGIGEVDIADTGDNNALWFKFGVGMDNAVSNTMFIRSMLLYGFRSANKWENNAASPISKSGNDGDTLLGHGFTIGVGLGLNL